VGIGRLLEIGWRHMVKMWSIRICREWFESRRVRETGEVGVNMGLELQAAQAQGRLE
jgi:hypothetical protein